MSEFLSATPTSECRNEEQSLVGTVGFAGAPEATRKTVMRTLLAIVLVLGVALSATAPADARRGARSANTKVYGYQARRGSSAECIRSRGADPGGDYRSYPCWAQWGFGPEKRR